MTPPPAFTFTSAVVPVCQIGMSANRQPEPDSWLDVSCYVHQVEAFRGRDRFTDRFQPGTASITFSNEDGWGDLVGVGPAVAAETLRPGRPIRVGLTGTWIDGTATRWLFRGWIDQCVPRYDPVEHDVVDVNCIDALGESGSQPAPAGPFQGANETANVRINRVLDAVGWFAPKRKVAASATTVQGTELGSQGIDLMGVAADSAGGVVFGDLDGDVVFRDLNWELYSPDTPPDGTIGNVDPGTPGIPYTPGYLDPAVGYVYWPDPPPFDRPSVLRVCASPGDGSLVAQGDVNLSVVGGQLRFESLGHVWNMGGFDGGCIEIAVCDPGDPPVRYDAPDDPGGSWVPFPQPAFEVDPSPTVELLCYSDAGLSDTPAGSITPGPIDPGPGGLLVVLFNAIGSATVDPRLDATLSGGGLTWRLVDHADAWDGGASSWIWVTEVGRHDPGPFSLTVSWTGTTRSHACTVWRVREYAGDYMAQVAAGFANRAVTHSDGMLEVIQPGDGPQAVTLTAVTAPTDVTIAQSIAEEGTPPYGAVFDDSDGMWTVPPLPFPDTPALLALPAPGLTAAGSTWSDDFERTDLGADWVLGLETGTGELPVLPTISSGAAVGPGWAGGSGDRAVATMGWASEVTAADQRIEVVFDHWYDISDPFCYMAIEIYNFGGGGDIAGHAQARRAAGFQFAYGSGGGALTINAYTYLDDGDTSGGQFTVTNPYAGPTGPMTLRLESYASGRQVVMLNGATVHDYVETETPFTTIGHQQGVWMSWRQTPGRTSPQILSVTGGGTGMVCDDFERADGPLGSTWMLSAGPGWAETVTPLTITSGAAVGTVASTTESANSNATQWATAATPGVTQSIQVDVEGLGSGTLPAQYVSLMTNLGDGKASQVAGFDFGAADLIRVELYHFEADGSPSTIPHIDLDRPAEPIQLKLESDPDGTQRAFINGEMVWTLLDAAPVAGSYIGFALDYAVTSPRVLGACIGGAGAGVTICDDFGRADGPIGSDWPVTGLFYGVGTSYPLAISGGDAIAAGTATPRYASGRRVENLGGIDQWIEAELSFGTHSALTYVELYTRLSDDFTGFNGYVYRYGSEAADWTFGIARYDGNTLSDWFDITGDIVGTFPGDPVTVRFESDLTGEHRLYANGVLLCSATDMTYFGPYIGVGLTVNNFTPRLHNVCVSGIGGDGGAPHRTSWVAGWRTDAISDTVAWSDVNTGPTDLQSSQAALVVDGDTSGDTPGDDDLVIGGFSDPYTGDIFEVERREGCDPETGDVVWLFDPSTGAPWADFTPSDPDAVIPPTPGLPMRAGDACPQTWDESADRSQMTTQVMIARQSPSNIPPLTYNFPGANPPTAGQVTLNAAQSEATVMRVHKTMNTAADATIWLRYLHTNDRVRFADADDTGVAVGYALTGEPAESATFFDLPIIWQDGQNPVPAGVVALTLTLLPQPPHLFYDAFGVPIYGVETLSRTDLINTSEDLLPTLADRILEVRGSNSIPRVEAVTLDARTGGFNQPTVMHLMSTAAPERPSRYRMRLQVNERPIYDRLCFVNSVRHFVARDEWTVRIALDVAEWAAQL